MPENYQPKRSGLQGVGDELAVLIIGGVIGATLEILFQPLPFFVLIILLILACVVWLLIQFWEYLKERLHQFQWWGISFTIGLIVGAVITLIISQGAISLPQIGLIKPMPTLTVTPSPTPQPPCPPLPQALPALAPITMDNVSNLRELSHVNVSGVLDVALSDNGQWLAVATRQGVCLYEWRTMQGKFRLFKTQVTAATFSPDGHLLAVGNIDGTVGVWDTQPEDIQVLWTLPAHEAPVTSLVFGPTSEWLVSASSDRTIRLWGARRSKEGVLLGELDTPVKALACSLDGRLASGSSDGKVALWDIQKPDMPDLLAGHRASVTSLAFSPRTEWLASASEDKTIRIWNTLDKVEQRRLGGHLDWVLSVNFSPDGRLLVSGSEDQTVRLWVVDTGAELRTLHGHTAGVYGVAFSPDGKLMISGSGDGTVRLWGVLVE
jgi:WD40 repeat protein